MSQAISLEQGLQGIFSLATNVNWNEIDSTVFQKAVVDDPVNAGAQFTLFLKNRAKLVIGEPRIIPITDEFHPETFIGEGWKIIPEETDERSVGLKELDLTKVLFETTLKKGESYVKGEEKLKRLKASNHIRLSGNAFKACWDNRHLLPESWKKDEKGNVRYIYFDGIVLQGPYGNRCVLYLYFRDGGWYWDYRWLEDGWRAHPPSAVLASGTSVLVPKVA